MLKLAVYGKGGIGKSTMTANLSAAFAALGKRVIQIGCDPKADSTINLLGGKAQQPVMEYLRIHEGDPSSLDEITQTGFGDILCIETGGPTPGLGCAGRGIIATFNLLEDLCPGVFGKRRGQGIESDRSAAEFLDHEKQDLAVAVVKAQLVHIKHIQRFVCDLFRDVSIAAYLRHVPDPLQDSRVILHLR